MSAKNSASGKLLIFSLDPNPAGTQVIEAQYNPKELGVDKSVPWQKAPTSTGDQPEMQFTAAEGRSMSFELFFDTYESGANVHTTYVDKLITLAMVMSSDPKAKEELKRPPRVRIKWGNGLPQFDGVIESVSTKYTMFLPDGTPVRATCSMKVKEASRASFKKGESGATGAATPAAPASTTPATK
jgi:Contractile injection system tube protein